MAFVFVVGAVFGLWCIWVCGVVCGIGWCQNDKGVPAQRVAKREGVALNEARHSWS